MSELGKASPEALAQFQEAVRNDPSLIGKLISWAIENGVMIMPDESAPAITAEEALAQLADEEAQDQGVGFDITAARTAQKRAFLESQRKALVNPKLNITEER